MTPEVIFSFTDKARETFRDGLVNEHMYTRSLRFSLSTEGFYFMYRGDKYNPGMVRAGLCDLDGKELASVVVHSLEVGAVDLTHHQVINHFEAQITLGKIR